MQVCKIPVLYVFKFEPPYFVKAIKRLYCSLMSINGQIENIFILNASSIDLDFLYDYKIAGLNIINNPINEYFNKAKLINYAVKKYLKDYNYYFASDIDLIWHLDFLNRCREEINKNKEPIRIIPYNYTMAYEFYEQDFIKLIPHVQKNFKNLKPNNWSHGNGLIHIPSFMKIQGYNEEFLGYSAEDQEFNSRIGKINKLIYTYDIADIHLWHEPMNREYVQANDKIWEESIYKSQQGDIIRNNEKWGEL